MATTPPDLNVLYDGPLYAFRDFRAISIPQNIAGVYTVWEKERFVYVGIGGTKVRYREPSDESEPSKPVKGLQGRLEQHFSGDRSSDRFCLLVFDRFVLATLTESEVEAATGGRLSLNERRDSGSTTTSPSATSKFGTVDRLRLSRRRFSVDRCQSVNRSSTRGITTHTRSLRLTGLVQVVGGVVDLSRTLVVESVGVP